ncbi:Acyl-coenzyme A thioesterase PaaI, contains HGG motif [Paracidovorax valerianellae]|uniref:Acyl-coenzyme A thioesterase PaaI, contains HGG motif n=2 Tax=Paracidovorax valerianellae TaxID=187868 RepID=A0A1G7BI67_9BURK|nr:Acyl-coenzyme A thioesterase PaaI, contains HGG motif [Paracidovorax valerianellae]
MQLQLEQLDDVPKFLRPWVRNLVLRRAVPFTRTARVEFIEMSPNRVEVRLPNEHRVQNHIGGIHASAMNLLAETATGMAIGLNVRDDCLPLAKNLKMVFRQRATGAMRAVAVLTDAQREALRDTDKGEMQVQVTVTDEAGIEPVECEFTWAWVPSSRPAK